MAQNKKQVIEGAASVEATVENVNNIINNNQNNTIMTTIYSTPNENNAMEQKIYELFEKSCEEMDRYVTDDRYLDKEQYRKEQKLQPQKFVDLLMDLQLDENAMKTVLVLLDGNYRLEGFRRLVENGSVSKDAAERCRDYACVI